MSLKEKVESLLLNGRKQVLPSGEGIYLIWGLEPPLYSLLQANYQARTTQKSQAPVCMYTSLPDHGGLEFIRHLVLPVLQST